VHQGVAQLGELQQVVDIALERRLVAHGPLQPAVEALAAAAVDKALDVEVDLVEELDEFLAAAVFEVFHRVQVEAGRCCRGRAVLIRLLRWIVLHPLSVARVRRRDGAPAACAQQTVWD
jgi:hypothetical protein